MIERSHYFDNLKFLLIFFVVLGHFIEPLILIDQSIKAMYYWIYSFHMPLFIFITGYFSKQINFDYYGKNIIEKIVIPYIIFQFLFIVFDYFVFHREKLEFHFFTPYWIMWFLFSLILWKLILPYVTKSKTIILVSIVLSVIIGYATDAGYYASIARTFVYFPYFIVGYFFDKKYLVFLNNTTVRIIACMSLIGLFTFYYFNSYYIDRKWFYGSVNYEVLGYDYWYAGVYRLLLIGVAIIASLAVMTLVPNRKIPLLTSLGRNTIYVYLFHAFIIKYLTTTSFYSHFYSVQMALLLIALALIVTLTLSSPLVHNVFKYIVYPTSILKKYKR